MAPAASTIHAQQLNALRQLFAGFARSARSLDVPDQQIAEWMLSISSRWLAAHGVSKTNIHLWVDHELGRAAPAPLVAAAAATNDFGGHR